MTQVSRKGFRDKNGKQVVIVPNVPGATAGNLASFDEEGNLQDSGIDAGLVGKAKFLYKLEIAKSGGAYTWGTSTTQALLEEIYNSLENGPYDALPVRVQIPGFTYAGYVAKGQVIGVKEIDLYVGTIAFQAYYNTSTNLWNAPVIVKSAVVLDALKSTEQLSSGNDYRLITSGAVKAALDGKRQIRQDDPDTLDHAIVSASASDGDVYVLLSVREDDDVKSAYVTHDSIPNLQRALEDPVKNSDPDSAYSNDKLITAAAVLNKLSSRLDKPDDSLMVKFKVSGGVLTLVSDTTEYNNIFELVTPNVTKTVTTFVGIYNSDDDVYIQFLGIVSVNGQYSNLGDGTLLEINVSIYVGGYTIYLNKNVSSGTITVSMDSFAALLQNS